MNYELILSNDVLLLRISTLAGYKDFYIGSHKHTLKAIYEQKLIDKSEYEQLLNRELWLGKTVNKLIRLVLTNKLGDRISKAKILKLLRKGDTEEDLKW